LRTSLDFGAGSCWESDDDGGSGGEDLVVVDGCEEWKDGRKVRWVTKEESGRRYTEDFTLIGGPLFSSRSVDSYVLVGVAVGVRTEVFPRFWDCGSDGGELEVWGEGADGFVLEDSSFRCLVIDGRVRSGGPADRRGRE